MFGASVANPSNLTPFYLSLSGSTPFTTNGPAFGGMSMPVACTFDRLSVSLYAVTGGNADTIAVTLVKNGVDTGLSCSLASSATLGNISQCLATTPVAAAVGDIFALHVTQTDFTPVVRIAMGTRCN